MTETRQARAVARAAARALRRAGIKPEHLALAREWCELPTQEIAARLRLLDEEMAAGVRQVLLRRFDVLVEVA